MAGNSKNFLIPFKIINAGDMSSATLTSAVTDIRYLDNVCIQCIATGAPVGRFDVQASADYAISSTGAVVSTGNWVTMDTASIVAADDVLFDLNQLSFPFIRLLYTKTSGTGTLNAYITAKAV